MRTKGLKATGQVSEIQESRGIEVQRSLTPEAEDEVLRIRGKGK